MAVVPSFAEAPPVVLIKGQVEFFVEEAAAKAREGLGAGGVEILIFDDDAPAERVAEALLNRSLFSPKRLVQLDVSRLLGTESPGRLLAQALEAWRRGGAGGRREAFRHARALLSALGLSAREDPAGTAEAAAKKVRKKEDAAELAEILSALPEEKGGPAILLAALRLLLERGNDGTVALATATAPPAGAGLLEEIARQGLVLEASVGGDEAGALARFARTRALEREVTLEPGAVDRLSLQTDGQPALFAAELEKLLEWAGRGGQIRAADVRENVEDEASEDIYAFYEAIGRRDARDALTRLERLFSERAVRAGDRVIGAGTDDGWPNYFLGMLTGELRRMLLIRALLEERGTALRDATRSYGTFQARVVPLLEEPVSPFGQSPFASQQGKVSAFVWFKAAGRASRYTAQELARALSRAAEVDVKLKTSSPTLETFTQYVGDLIAGRG